MEEGHELQSKADDMDKRPFGEARSYEDGSGPSGLRIALFSGPHCSGAPIGDYGKVLLVATGFGIAAQLPLLKELIQGFNRSQVRTRTIHLVWQLDDLGDEKPAIELLDRALKEDTLDHGYVDATGVAILQRWKTSSQSTDSAVTTLPKTQALKSAPVREDSLKPAATLALKKSTPVDQSTLPLSKPRLSENEISISRFESKDVDQPVENTPRGPYDEFMALDLAGTAMVGSENNEDPDLVAIKRVKKTSESRINRIAPFTSDHLVQIKDVYEDGNDVVIVSETMDVTLRQLTGILQGPLKAFQIAAICKEVSNL
ncbi:MAG: hypothetical protein Q9217_004251 [Psora testacea]